jgi:hypothetical protein
MGRQSPAQPDDLQSAAEVIALITDIQARTYVHAATGAGR